jgi:glycosyltransferase involved in cell wall biosynthesis
VCRPASKIGKYAAEEGIEVLYLPIHGGVGFFFSAVKLISFLWRNHYDIIHCHGGRDHLLAVMARLLSPGIKVVRTKHNLNPVKGGFGALLQYNWLTHRLTGVSQAACEYLQLAGVPSSKIQRVYSAYDATVVKKQEPDPETLKGLGIGRNDLVIGTMGRLSSKSKGTVDLLHAAPIILEKLPHARFLLVGKIVPRIIKLSESIGLRNKIIFAGFRTDVPQVLACMDIYVQPSVKEALCSAIVQAMAMGKPVVATRVGGIPELVVDGQTGLLCEAENPENLAQNIIKLANQPELRHQMGLRGRERAIKHFSLDHMIDKIENIYRNVIQK